MKQLWKMDQFGIGIAGKLDRYKDLILKLDPDLVQMPLHVYLPTEECCEEIIANGIKLIGKLVLPSSMVDVPVQRFREILTRYQGLIKIWDFGGEPETRPPQPGYRFAGTPLQFRNQMRDFYSIAKVIDEANEVGGCGWISATFNGYFGNEDRSTFLRRCLDLGITEYTDFISLNFYSYGYGGTKNVIAGIGKINELLAWHHIEKPIVVSEFGVPCSGDPTFLHIIQTEERQAISLVEQSILFSSVGIDYAIWWALQYNGWGLVDDNGNPRPSFRTFQTMSKILKGAEYKAQYKAFPSTTVEERWATDKFNWHVFSKQGKEIHVIWLSGGVKMERDFPFDDAEVYTLYGDKMYQEIEKLTILASPVYIIAKPGEINSSNFLLG